MMGNDICEDSWPAMASHCSLSAIMICHGQLEREYCALTMIFVLHFLRRGTLLQPRISQKRKIAAEAITAGQDSQSLEYSVYSLTLSLECAQGSIGKNKNHCFAICEPGCGLAPDDFCRRRAFLPRSSRHDWLSCDLTGNGSCHFCLCACTFIFCRRRAFLPISSRHDWFCKFSCASWLTRCFESLVLHIIF